MPRIDTLNILVDDPYTFGSGTGILKALPTNVPQIEYPDIYNFLINARSLYTKDELKAYKSLEGYKYLVAGWVNGVSIHNVTVDNTKVVLTASVRHSQAVSKAALKPWIGAEKCGTICAHCSCMAGQGEACSHISALLFAAEAYTSLIKDTACTSRPYEWLSPNFKNVNYAPICNIDFSAPITPHISGDVGR